MTFQNVSQQAFDYLSGQLKQAGTTVADLGGGNFEFSGSGVKCKVAFEVSTSTLQVQPDNMMARLASGKIQATLSQHLAAFQSSAAAKA